MARLKKGSAAAKAWGRKMKRLRAKSSTSSKKRRVTRRISPIKKKRKTTKMARKRKVKRRAKTSSVWGINTGNAAAAALYGAGRAKMSNALMPVTSKIPLGAISDEVGMIVAAQLLKKMVFKKAGIVKKALTMGQAIEFARLGEAAISGQINLGALTGGNSDAASGNLF